MGDPLTRWLMASMFLGLPGLFRIAQAYYPGSRTRRRADFEKHYRCRVPVRIWPDLDRRLALPDKWFGWLSVLMVPVAADIPFRFLDVDTAIALLPMSAAVLHLTLDAIERAIDARFPLRFTSSSGVGRLRTVTASDFVPRRLRVTARLATAAAVGTGAIGVWAATAGHAPAGVSVVVFGVAPIAPLLLVEASARRLHATAEPGGDDSETYLSDSLRCHNFHLAYQQVVTIGSLALVAQGAAGATAISSSYRADAAILWTVLFLLAPGVIWAARTDRQLFVDRLWQGRVPPALATGETPAEIAPTSEVAPAGHASQEGA